MKSVLSYLPVIKRAGKAQEAGRSESQKTAHSYMPAHQALDSLLNLKMRLGRGTGTALAMSVVEAAVKVFNEVMAFGEAGVPDKG